MPSTQLNIRLGSDNSIFRHDVPVNVKRSVFDLSRKRDFTLDAGAIVPVDLIETVPGDSFEISINYLLKSMPLAVAPFTNFKIRTHWYYCRLADLWKGAETFITKGRSGSIELTIPKISPYVSFWSTAGKRHCNASCQQSLSSYLGLPPAYYIKTTSVTRNNSPFSPIFFPDELSNPEDFTQTSNVGNAKLRVNALPFFMYQKIYRMAYVVPNLLQDNKIWFPDDINDGWRINYSGSNLWSVDNGQVNNDGLFTPFDTWKVSDPSVTISFNPETDASSTSVVPGADLLNSQFGIQLKYLRFALFEDDRFTTALPWAQRGSAPVVDVSSSQSISVKIDNFYLNTPSTDTASSYTGPLVVYGDTPDTKQDTEIPVDFYAAHYDQAKNPNPVGRPFYLSGTGLTDTSVVGFSFNLNQFRELVALSVWQERNARTQGSYNETIFAHFNSSPKHEDYEPVYIGGTSDVINFSEVVQTSSSQDSTPQGTTTGLAQSINGGNVGYFRAPDYGYIMGVMIIQPETVYSQSVEKLWFREVMEDFYMPEYEGLGLQEILNKEIYPRGTVDDDGLFGYQERNTEYKTRPNQAIGFFTLTPAEDKLFSAYSQSRQFSMLPKLSTQFVTMDYDNLRRDWLAVPSQPAFRCSFATNVKAVRPMAYKSVPQTFGF